MNDTHACRIDAGKLFSAHCPDHPLSFSRERKHVALIREHARSGADADELYVNAGDRKTCQQSCGCSPGSHRKNYPRRFGELTSLDLSDQLQGAIHVAEDSDWSAASDRDVARG